MAKFDVITIGFATRDVFLGGANIPQESAQAQSGFFLPLGAKLEVDQIHFSSGGGGTNTAATFARQGFNSACLSIIGDDINGREILEELRKEGIDVSNFRIDHDLTTPYSVILVKNGERTILTYRGAIKFDSILSSLDAVESSWLMLDSVGGNYELFKAVSEKAVSKNMSLASNPDLKELAHGLEKLAPVFKNFKIVTMNQDEAANLLGLEPHQEEEIFKGMDEIVGGVFVMTRGPEGVKVSDGQHIYSAGIPDSPVIERTGAGDAFASGFVAEYIRSGDIPKAIQLATANASSVVTKYGGKEGILKKGDMGPWPLVEVLQKL